jgi:glyoxylase-like metal-dependent hydrolase (beta-lactamase superfamily II)
VAYSGRIHSLRAGLSVAHLVEADGGWVLVDTGSPGRASRILRALRRLGGGALRLIYITHAHFDHYGSARALRERTGAPVAIHAADEAAMAAGQTPLRSVRGRGWLGRLLLPLAERALGPEPTQADVPLTEGQNLAPYGLDAVVMHTPGHTRGSSSLIVTEDVAFVGDLISTNGRLHAQNLYASDWSELADSLARLKRQPLSRIYAGHGRRPVTAAQLQRIPLPSV